MGVNRRALLLAAALAAVFISGCAGGHANLKSGERVATPQQWAEYCERHPERAECRS